MDIQNTKDTQLFGLYQKLERLIAAGEVASAYGGAQNIDDPDGDVLSEFVEFIDEFYPDNRVDWLEAFYQVFAWQFQSCHEGVCTYYSNFYDLSEDQTVKKTSDFLKGTKHTDLSRTYSMGLDAGQSEYAQIDKWINNNLELVWEFYVDILETHKGCWPT